MVSIELSNEEKFEVLLVAFTLFLIASCISICIAATCCPLNKWLHERATNKRRSRHLGAHDHNYSNHRPFTTISTLVRHSPTLVTNGSKSSRQTGCSLSFSGPPPTYDVALSAARVQSLISSLIVHSGSNSINNNHIDSNIINDCSNHIGQPAGLRERGPSLGTQDAFICEKELDLGDYFHPPKEMLNNGGPFGEPSLEQVFVPFDQCDMADHAHQQTAAYDQSYSVNGAISAGNCHHSPPPVMLRLWARLIEPSELVDLARNIARDNKRNSSQNQVEPQSGGGALAGVANTIGDHWEQAEAGIRRLSTQLSIPHIFGSLIAIGSSKSSTLNGTHDDICIEVRETDEEQSEDKAADRQLACRMDESSNQLNSIGSSTTSGDFEHGGGDELRASRRSRNGVGRSSSNRGSLMSQAMSTPSGKRLLSQLESIASRVLHMNVASFSYVKDEKLVSSRKHCQLNLKHFFEDDSDGSTQENGLGASGAQSAGEQSERSGKRIKSSNEVADSKVCQLMISICDIENLLNSCWLEEKACVLLSQYSSVYVRCDIIGSKSKYPVRLLRNPLRVLQQAAKNDFRRDSEDTNKHTIDFGEVISASAVEQPAPLPVVDRSIIGKVDLCRDRDPVVSSTSTNSSADSSLAPAATAAVTTISLPAGDRAKVVVQNDDPSKQTGLTADVKATNWRHDPSADGKAIVTFNSVPKLIADMHQFTAAARIRSQQVAASIDAADNQQQPSRPQDERVMGHHSTDLIQFDSVFISPILSQSLIENSYLRLRIYSQSKYINDTCLAELKLPLRQLTHSPTKDNLYDIGARRQDDNQQEANAANGAQVSPTKSGLILNNLVANLVTADTGEPLTSIVEQVSAERAKAATRETKLSAITDEDANKAKQSDIGTTIKGALFGLSSSTFGSGPKSCSTDLSSLSEDPEVKKQQQLARAGNSLGTALDRLNKIPGERRADESRYYCETHCQKDEQIERLSQNRIRSLMVSHWLDYLSAPTYECETVEEVRGELVMGLTYLPTSNRLIMHAHRANLDSSDAGKRLAKKIRLSANATYQLRLLMVANGRVLKRKQTRPAERLEWDSQEPITFDLAHSNVEQPSFIVALVVRNGPDQQAAGNMSGLKCGLSDCTCAKVQRDVNHPAAKQANGGMHEASITRSDPELVRRYDTHSSGRSTTASRRNDLVAGHVVLGDEIWKELRSHPRKQFVKQLKMS